MTAISLPFRVDGYGRIATTSDVYKVYADRVRSLICTRIGERVMQPRYGSDITRELQDMMTQAPDLIDVQLQTAFLQWLPDLTYVSVDVTYEDEEAGEIRLDVTYEVPDLAVDQQQSITVPIALN